MTPHAWLRSVGDAQPLSVQNSREVYLTNTNARQTQHRHEREEPVSAGVHSLKHDCDVSYARRGSVSITVPMNAIYGPVGQGRPVKSSQSLFLPCMPFGSAIVLSESWISFGKCFTRVFTPNTCVSQELRYLQPTNQSLTPFLPDSWLTKVIGSKPVSTFRLSSKFLQVTYVVISFT